MPNIDEMSAPSDPGEEHVRVEKLCSALKKIARGRLDNGRPLPAEDSRQAARAVLLKLGMNWND